MKKLVNIASLLLIFVAPIIFIIARYSSTTEAREVPAETTIGGIGVLVIVGVAFVLVMFVKNALHSKLQKDPFGTISILFYGFVLLSVVGSIWLGTHYIAQEATYRAEALRQTFEGYRHTATWLFAFVGSGMALQLINVIYTLKNK